MGPRRPRRSGARRPPRPGCAPTAPSAAPGGRGWRWRGEPAPCPGSGFGRERAGCGTGTAARRSPTRAQVSPPRGIHRLLFPPFPLPGFPLAAGGGRSPAAGAPASGGRSGLAHLPGPSPRRGGRGGPGRSPPLHRAVPRAPSRGAKFNFSKVFWE